MYRQIPINVLRSWYIENKAHFFRKGDFFTLLETPINNNLCVNGWYLPKSYFKLV